MQPPLPSCFLHAKGSCYFENRCKEQKEQLAGPVDVKPIQLPDFLSFVRKKGMRRREVLRMQQGMKSRGSEFNAVISIPKEKFSRLTSLEMRSKYFF